jgi:hypothetical protein
LFQLFQLFHPVTDETETKWYLKQNTATHHSKKGNSRSLNLYSQTQNSTFSN